jgi:hypothetical protein
MRGDMFAEFPERTVWLVTANSYVKSNGNLVMGRGAAARAARLWPEMPSIAGKRVLHLGDYHVMIMLGFGRDRHAGIFQTKRHFHDPSDPELIRESCRKLEAKARGMRDYVFRVNYPGIGLGGLSVDQVQPILERHLAWDNIEVWRF